MNWRFLPNAFLNEAAFLIWKKIRLSICSWYEWGSEEFATKPLTQTEKSCEDLDLVKFAEHLALDSPREWSDVTLEVSLEGPRGKGCRGVTVQIGRPRVKGFTSAQTDSGAASWKYDRRGWGMASRRHWFN